jgi:hypothetical protein
MPFTRTLARNLFLFVLLFVDLPSGPT